MADRVFAVALIVLTTALWTQTHELPGPTGGAEIGPAFLPRVILSALFVLAVALLIHTVVKAQEAIRFTGISEFFRLHWRVPALLAVVGIYIALMEPIGFIGASVVFLTGSFALLIREYSRSVVIAAIVLTVGLPVGLAWLFESALQTFLP